MEQLHHQWIVEEEEAEEELFALEGRKTLQHEKESIIVTAVAPSFSSAPSGNDVCSASVEEEPLLQKEAPHAQKEEQVEETNNVVENDNRCNDDSATVGLGIVAEFVGNAMDGEALKSAIITAAASQNKNSVYFDKQLDNDADGASSFLPKSCEEGEFDMRVENSDIQSNPCNEVNNQCMKAIDDKVHSGSELSPLHNSSETQATTVENFGDVSSAKAYPNLTEEIDQQLKEFDVEAVLAKQETHDLFCPNCKSCITKRVILRKRKRNTPNLDTKVKRDKSDTELVNSAAAHEANQGGQTIATSDVGRLDPRPDNYELEREPEVFRCLSCFSFFIPMRHGIKLFPSFSGTREPETSQNPSVIPVSNIGSSSKVAASNANWFISLFTSNKGKKTGGQVVGDASIENSTTGSTEQHHSSFTDMLTSPGIVNPESPLANTAISKDVKPTLDIKPGYGGVDLLIPSNVKPVKIESWIENGNRSGMVLQNEPLFDQNDLSSSRSFTGSSSDVMNGLQKVRREQFLSNNVRTDVGEKKHGLVDMIKTDIPKPESAPLATDATTGINFNVGKPAKDDILKPYEGSPISERPQQPADKKPEIAPDPDGYSSLMDEARPPAQSFGSAVVPDDGTRDKESSGVNATVPSDQEFKKMQKDIEEEINPSVTKEKKDIPKRESVPLATDPTTEMNFNAEKPAKDAIPKPYEGPPIFEESQQHVDKTPEIAPDSFSSSMEEAQSPAQSFGSEVVADDVASDMEEARSPFQSLDSEVVADDVVSDKQSPEVNAKIPSDQEFKVQKDIEEEINPSVTKEKKEAVKSSTSQTADNVPVEGTKVTEAQAQTQIYIGEQPTTEIDEHQDWKILKSIVYGGLIESITSLGIVSSAAASGATPLNIIALGLANLIGGLFIIGHNLIELKNEQEDQYEELLGRKANFLLHAVVAVLSFLIFGSVPLVIYGLLMSKQYYAEVKIAVVAVVSIVCIIVLAIGKVYTSRTSKSYIKTVLKYVGMALAASGLSYIAGDLFKDLLDKFSSSESGYVLAMPLSGTRKMRPAWISY